MLQVAWVEFGVLLRFSRTTTPKGRLLMPPTHRRTTHHPGEITHRTGYYPLLDSTGRDTGARYLLQAGNPMPPTPGTGWAWGQPHL